MSAAVFPIALPGLLLAATVAPRFATKVQTSVSGRETRAAFMAYPLWNVTLSFEFLRGGNWGVDLDTLAGFILQMKGSWDSFLISVPNDNAVVDMPFAVGDGASKVFQLARTRGAGGYGFAEPCMNIQSLSNIKAAGSVVTGSGYSIGSTGLVTFVNAPAMGATLTWSGAFYYRCRFTKDTADFSRILSDLWELKALQMTGAPGNRV